MSRSSISAALDRLDGRALFFGLYGAGACVALIGYLLLFGWLNEAVQTGQTRLVEETRTERILKQTWWLDERQASAKRVAEIKERFWKADTIGLVRADVERFLQASLARHGLRAQAVIVDTKVIEKNSLSLVRAQIKASGPLPKVLTMVEELAGGPQDVFVAGVIIRLFNNETGIELTLDAPTLISAK